MERTSAATMGDDRDGVTIDKGLLLMAFGRDVDYHDTVPQLIYLDRHTGDIVWLYGSDDDAYMETGLPVEENREGREAVAAEPDRYLEIPGLDHEDHHRMLRLFLRSRLDQRQRATAACGKRLHRLDRQMEERCRGRGRHSRILCVSGSASRGDGSGIPSGKRHRAELEIVRMIRILRCAGRAPRTDAVRRLVRRGSRR